MRPLVIPILVLLLLLAFPSPATPTGAPWDPELDPLNVTLVPAQDCDAGCWRLVSAEYLDEGESQGLHHAFARLLDAKGNVLVDMPWHAAWYDGNVRILTKPEPDWADFPLWQCYFPDQGEQAGTIVYAGDDEAASDVVVGLGLPYCLHVSYRLVWQWQEPGTPTPTATPCAACKDRLWLPLMFREGAGRAVPPVAPTTP